jgi:hypothetical protein
MGDYDIDWQAWATLATGILAVGAAIFVGLRQMKISSRQNDILDRQALISHRQTEILDRQAGIEEAKLKAELFDRRLQTFEVTADFLLHLGSMPADDRPVHKERWDKFVEKYRESQFLFSDEGVYRALTEIFNQANNQIRDITVIRAQHEQGGEHDASLSKIIHERTIWQLERLNSLADVFRADLNIRLTSLIE